MPQRKLPVFVEQILNSAALITLPSGKPRFNASQLALARILMEHAQIKSEVFPSIATLAAELKGRGVSCSPPTFDSKEDGKKGRRRLQGGYLPTLKRRFEAALGEHAGTSEAMSHRFPLTEPRMRTNGSYTSFIWRCRPLLERLAALGIEAGVLRAAPTEGALGSFFAPVGSLQPRPLRSPRICTSQIGVPSSSHSDQQLDNTYHPGVGGTPPPEPPSASALTQSTGIATEPEPSRAAQRLEGDSREAYDALLSLEGMRPAAARYHAVNRSRAVVEYAIRRTHRPSTRAEAKLAIFLLSHVLVFDEAYESTEPDELAAWWQAERAISCTPRLLRLQRATAWRRVVDELRVVALQRVGEARWEDVVEQTSYLGYRGGKDYLLVRSREQRDELAQLEEDLDLAIRRAALDEDDEDVRKRLRSLRPTFVVRVQAPAITPNASTATAPREDPMPPGIPVTYAKGYRMLTQAHVATSEAGDLCKHHDAWRIGLVVREARKRAENGEITRPSGWIVTTLRLLEELDELGQVKAEVLIQYGFWPRREWLQQLTGAAGDRERCPLARLYEVIEQGKHTLRAKGVVIDGPGHGARVDLGAFLKAALMDERTGGEGWTWKGPRAEKVREEAAKMAEIRRARRVEMLRRHHALEPPTAAAARRDVAGAALPQVELPVSATPAPVRALLQSADDAAPREPEVTSTAAIKSCDSSPATADEAIQILDERLADMDDDARALTWQVAELMGDVDAAIPLVRDHERELVRHNLTVVLARARARPGSVRNPAGLFRSTVTSGKKLTGHRLVGAGAVGSALERVAAARPGSDDTLAAELLEDVRCDVNGNGEHDEATVPEVLPERRKLWLEVWAALRRVADPVDVGLWIEPLANAYMGTVGRHDLIRISAIARVTVLGKYGKTLVRACRRAGLEVKFVEGPCLKTQKS